VAVTIKPLPNRPNDMINMMTANSECETNVNESLNSVVLVEFIYANEQKSSLLDYYRECRCSMNTSIYPLLSREQVTGKQCSMCN
jgi:hypothetical protein